MRYTLFQSGLNYRFKLMGKNSPKLPPQRVTRQVEQPSNEQARLAEAAARRRYAKVKQATRLTEDWKPENRRKTLGPG